MDRYMARYFDQQTDNRPDETEVVEVSYDDAVAWCAICAGPIFDGQPVESSERSSEVVIDRHGEAVIVTAPSLVWHRIGSHCAPEA